MTLLNYLLTSSVRREDDLGPQRCYRYTRVIKMCEMIHLRSTCRVFNNRRGHLRTQKASKPLAAGDPTWGAYTAPQAQ